MNNGRETQRRLACRPALDFALTKPTLALGLMLTKSIVALGLTLTKPMWILTKPTLDLTLTKPTLMLTKEGKDMGLAWFEDSSMGCVTISYCSKRKGTVAE